MTSGHQGAQGAPATLRQAQEPGFGAEPRLTNDPLLEVLERYWGYTAFRPLQREAMEAILDGRDSVVVLPTGGGKSLCFQAPALVRPGSRWSSRRSSR